MGSAIRSMVIRQVVDAVYHVSEKTGLSPTEVCMSILSALNAEFNVSVKLTRKRKGNRGAR